MPAYQVYPAEQEANIYVQAMTLEQRGTFAILLNAAWIEGGVPNDLPLLARVCRCETIRFEAEVWPGVLPCFELQGDRLVNGEQERYRSSKREYVEQRRGAGQRSAARRYQPNERSTDVHQALDKCSTHVQHAFNTPTPPPTPTPTIATSEVKPDADAGQWDRIRWIQAALSDYVPDWVKPDVAICRKIDAALCGASLEELREFLERLHDSGKKPGQSWAWFLSVIGGEFSKGRAA